MNKYDLLMVEINKIIEKLKLNIQQKKETAKQCELEIAKKENIIGRDRHRISYLMDIKDVINNFAMSLFEAFSNEIPKIIFSVLIALLLFVLLKNIMAPLELAIVISSVALSELGIVLHSWYKEIKPLIKIKRTANRDSIDKEIEEKREEIKQLQECVIELKNKIGTINDVEIPNIQEMIATYSQRIQEVSERKILATDEIVKDFLGSEYDQMMDEKYKNDKTIIDDEIQRVRKREEES